MEMREVYCQSLLSLAEKDKRVCVLEADLMRASGTKTFYDAYPERTFNTGVSEANMVGMASGLSATGKIPFVASFGCFATRRVYDQFFLSANYARLNVNLVGTDPGVTAEYNGGTHMPFEDAGLMRNVPELQIIEPSDETSLRALIPQIAAWPQSVYLRLHRKEGWQYYHPKESFAMGKGKRVQEGGDVTLISLGLIMLQQTLAAGEILAGKGIRAEILDALTLKPLDRDLILASAGKTGRVITCENHNIYNGLGSAVAEVLAEEGLGARLKRVGSQDRFGQVGKMDFLMEDYGLTAPQIAKAALELLK